MTLINAADAIYLGNTAVDKIYLGDTQVWPAGVAGFVGSAMLGGGLFPVVITGNGERQANLGGVMVDTSED